jgi:hypothetical protein
MSQSEYESAVAEFLRNKGVTRCPTVCAAPTQAEISAADRDALSRREAELDERRREKLQEAWRRAIGVG